MGPSLQAFIAHAIASYDPLDHPLAERLRAIAANDGMLPLVFDVAVCVGIRADLSVWESLWEDWGEHRRISDGPRPVTLLCNRDRAIAEGSRRYPPLRALLPERPSPAPICPSCDDRTAQPEAPVCVLCGGLGWIPERWYDPTFFRLDLTTLVWR